MNFVVLLLLVVPFVFCEESLFDKGWSLVNNGNINEGIQIFEKVAFQEGLGAGYSALGFLSSFRNYSGSGAKSYLFHSIAVEDKNEIKSRMVIGSRYLHGIGVEKECPMAVSFYEEIAYKAVKEWEKNQLPRARGNSAMPYLDPSIVMSSTETSTTQEDVITYYDFASQRGDVSAQIYLAQVYYYGTLNVQQNFEKALVYVKLAAENYHPAALGLLGEMYYLGLGGLSKSESMALKYFKEGAKLGSAIALNGMGLLTMQSDTTEALSYFMKAAEKDHPEAQYNAGRLFSFLKHPKKASHYMVIAARHSYLPAMYDLAQMYLNGVGVLQSCQIAATFYKAVAERNPEILADFKAAKADFDNNRMDQAILRFFILSEMGIEQAQANLAYIYEKLGRQNDSLLWYHRSAYQGNLYARIKVGDLFYYGESGVEQSFINAAKFYQAADLENHAQATFNLGLMHLWGIGLDQDFHLAKRYFDKTLVHQPNAFLAVYSCLSILYYQWYLIDSGFALTAIILLFTANVIYRLFRNNPPGQDQ